MAYLQVINAMTEQSDWLLRVQEEMAHGQEILLVLPTMDDIKSKALAKLCHAYRYIQGNDVNGQIPPGYEMLLEVDSYAAKEHGIAVETVCLLHPERTPARPHILA